MAGRLQPRRTKGDTGDPGPKGDTGATGPKGDPGADGTSGGGTAPAPAPTFTAAKLLVTSPALTIPLHSYSLQYHVTTNGGLSYTNQLTVTKALDASTVQLLKSAGSGTDVTGLTLQTFAPDGSLVRTYTSSLVRLLQTNAYDPATGLETLQFSLASVTVAQNSVESVPGLTDVMDFRSQSGLQTVPATTGLSAATPAQVSTNAPSFANVHATVPANYPSLSNLLSGGGPKSRIDVTLGAPAPARSTVSYTAALGQLVDSGIDGAPALSDLTLTTIDSSRSRSAVRTTPPERAGSVVERGRSRLEPRVEARCCALESRPCQDRDIDLWTTLRRPQIEKVLLRSCIRAVGGGILEHMFEERGEVPPPSDGGLQPSTPADEPPPPADPPSLKPWEKPSPPGFDARVLTGVPGEESVVMLLRVDPEALDRWDASAAAIGCELAERLIQGLQLRLLAVAQGGRREKGELSPSGAELTAATGVHPVTAACRADLGCSAVTRLPRTLALLEAGRFTRRHVELVERATRDLTDDQAARVDRKVGPGPAGLRRRLAEAIEQVAPGQAQKQTEKATANRDIAFWTDTAEGTAGIELVGPIDRIALIKAAIDSQARNKLPHDPRSLGQRRFDVLTDWARTVLGLPPRPGQPSAEPCGSCGRARSNAVAVNVTVSLEALLGLSDALGDLDGLPVPAAVARQLAADGPWRRFITAPRTGELLDVAPHTYRPGDKLARWIVARDRTCRFPTCTVPARQTQLDHVREFHHRDHAGNHVHGPRDGTTTEANLAANCQPHHRLKTETAWTYSRIPTGTTTWTSPGGRTYTVEPDHYADDPVLTNYLTEQTRRRQARQAAAHPQPAPPPDHDDEPPF
jgi:hypothetical protein